MKQGGILSSLFFNVYMDNLSAQLNSQHIGCSTGYVVVKHMLYADDIALFSPFAKGLQKLLDMCFTYGCSHDIQFNPSKSVVMYILTLVNLELLGPWWLVATSYTLFRITPILVISSVMICLMNLIWKLKRGKCMREVICLDSAFTFVLLLVKTSCSPHFLIIYIHVCSMGEVY